LALNTVALLQNSNVTRSAYLSYRELNKGEIIMEGDEYFHPTFGCWQKTEAPGYRVFIENSNLITTRFRYRRKNKKFDEHKERLLAIY
jgi:hypothetical protein